MKINMENGRYYILTRKYAGKEYHYHINIPGYGVKPHISCVTPENAFGYPDIVLLSEENKAYTLYRYLPKWILKKIEKKLRELSAEFIGEE